MASSRFTAPIPCLCSRARLRISASWNLSYGCNSGPAGMSGRGRRTGSLPGSFSGCASKVASGQERRVRRSPAAGPRPQDRAPATRRPTEALSQDSCSTAHAVGEHRRVHRPLPGQELAAQSASAASGLPERVQHRHSLGQYFEQVDDPSLDQQPVHRVPDARPGPAPAHRRSPGQRGSGRASPGSRSTPGDPGCPRPPRRAAPAPRRTGRPGTRPSPGSRPPWSAPGRPRPGCPGPAPPTAVPRPGCRAPGSTRLSAM